MRRIRTILASALIIAVLTLGFLLASDLLRLEDWSRWATGAGLFAIGGSAAGDIWWREIQELRTSRREGSRTHPLSGIRFKRLAVRARRRIRAARRRMHVSRRMLDGLFFLGVLLVLLTALLAYVNEDYLDILQSIFVAPGP
jgi:hypothetical protein